MCVRKAPIFVPARCSGRFAQPVSNPNMTSQGMDICDHCGNQYMSNGEGLALLVAFVAAVPLAVLGIGLALSNLPARWTHPWTARAIHAALVAQGGCLFAGLLLLVIAGGMLAEDFDVTGALLASPLVLHVALNVAGLVGWRKVAEALPSPPVH